MNVECDNFKFYFCSEINLKNDYILSNQYLEKVLSKSTLRCRQLITKGIIHGKVIRIGHLLSMPCFPIADEFDCTFATGQFHRHYHSLATFLLLLFMASTFGKCVQKFPVKTEEHLLCYKCLGTFVHCTSNKVKLTPRVKTLWWKFCSWQTPPYDLQPGSVFSISVFFLK